MIEQLRKAIALAVENQGIVNPIIFLTHPEDNTFGDFSTNIALVYSKEMKVSPKELAEKIVKEIEADMPKDVEFINIAGPGFINFKLKDSYFVNEIINQTKEGKEIGKIDFDKNKQIMVEYTDPNPFKIFHIGHLMANTIGESLSRIVEFSSAKVIRACYQGDVGLHVAKTIWAIMKNGEYKDDIKYLGDMYVEGSNKYDSDEIAKKEIVEVNKKIFAKSDPDINKIYDAGKKLSLEYFDTIYKKLDTKFDKFFFESEVADDGIKIVNEFLQKGIFEKSDGAIVFPGEKYGEHTRVFINSQGLPTYEAKELGLTKMKFELYPDLTESIVVTANEQSAYFKVIIASMKEMYPDLASKIKHLSHGLLRPSSGKMSSRKGNIVSADDLIEEFEELVEEKLKDRDFPKDEHNEIKRDIAVAGLKYMILRQAIGGDIIYEPTRAVSFEGDSGPYLQYSVVRANAIINKAKEAGISIEIKETPEHVEFLEKLLLRFSETVERSRIEYAPHYIVTYLIELSSAFNSYYTKHQIIDEKDGLSPYRIALTKLFAQVMTNGLWVLGIKVPKRM
jgi:arginyl-tRNA synthetase